VSLYEAWMFNQRRPGISFLNFEDETSVAGVPLMNLATQTYSCAGRTRSTDDTESPGTLSAKLARGGWT